MPTSHDCEDDECVDGSVITPATVYVQVQKLNNCIHVCEDKNQLEFQQYTCRVVCISEVTEVSIGTYGTRVSSVLLPGSSS